MTIKKDMISHVGQLARIGLTPEEQELYARQINDILSYMDKLNILDTKDVEPMSHATSMGNVFREDISRASLTKDEALRNAPEREGSFFKVPKIIE